MKHTTTFQLALAGIYLSDIEIRDLVDDRWGGDAYRAEAWYRAGDTRADAAIAARIREVYAAQLAATRDTARAARRNRRGRK